MTLATFQLSSARPQEEILTVLMLFFFKCGMNKEPVSFLMVACTLAARAEAQESSTFS